ncbi:glutamine amidotransferase [Herbiconiux moechotypicola]|uniref:Glutamine amidotransferase n=1 Tax=Herbiconiux moechotypicola TaxID=637393 RepID=A0ABN3DZV8_9MICO|nr:glutamine amidotransferase [Herbiconiux moechotypicola]MCS5731150.1 glutamine amidotransferase [Herbiconiux moechotypicola]
MTPTAPTTGRRAVVVQHDPTVALGNFGPVLEEHGYTIDLIDARTPGFTEALADAADAELLVVLGSTAGVYESESYPFIAPEIAHLQQRLAERRPTLGVCFGAQIIAAALGEEVRRGDTVEVGYREVTPTAEGFDSPVRHVAGTRMAQWHGDTFDLPTSVTLLASSAEYRHEAYGSGDWLLAVQFHPELTDEMHEQWLVGDAAFVAEHGYDAEALRDERARHGAAMQTASRLLLSDYLARLPR